MTRGVGLGRDQVPNRAISVSSTAEIVWSLTMIVYLDR